MNTALQAHLLPLDLPADKWGACYEARYILVRALRKPIPVTIFTAIAGRQDQLDGDRSNLRFPINPRLERPSQAIPASAIAGGAS